MSVGGPSAKPPLSGKEVRGRIIVARDQADLCEALSRCFARDEGVQVLFDRRRWERRQRIQTCEPDRRGMDRRRPTTAENDLRRRSFMVAPQ
jgi:hypothetical protein